MLLGSMGCALFLPAPSAPPETSEAAAKPLEPWILIDSRAETLTVFRHGAPPIVFGNLAFGAAGVKEKRRRGDDVTPRGVYSVGWIRTESKFVHFIGLNYPSVVDAERGLHDGVIGEAAYERIKRAHERGERPPQDTALGGQIGIHGVGKGSLEIHRIANWTSGCIAMENLDVRRLARMVRVGMRVEIR